MENGNTENGGMEERGNGNQNSSPDRDTISGEVEGVAEDETEVVTCIEGLELGMEVCTYDSLGMGMDCDEEILTASSLEHVVDTTTGREEGGGERSVPFHSPQNYHENLTSPFATQQELTPSSQPDSLTLSRPQEELTLSDLGSERDYKEFSGDELSSSVVEESSQSSQSDSTYCISHASSMMSSSSDVTKDEEVGGAKDEASRGGGGRKRKRGGKRDARREKGKFERKPVGTGPLRPKVLGDPKVILSRVQRQTMLQRRKAVLSTEADSSDSNELAAEDDPSSQKNKGKRSSLLLQSSRSPHPPPPKKTKLPPEQPPGNLLGSILTDIPEIDIRPMALLSRKMTTKIESNKVRDKKEQKRAERKRSDCNPSSKSCPSNHPTSPPASAHYRILMSWERDYSLGLRATRAPVLFALDNIPDKLRAVKGGWMNKAKLIWTTWRRTSVAKRDEYCEKAKLNRLKMKEKSAAVDKLAKRSGQPTGTKSCKTRPKSTKPKPPTPMNEPSSTNASMVDDKTMATTASTSSDKGSGEPSDVSPSVADNETGDSVATKRGDKDSGEKAGEEGEKKEENDTGEKGQGEVGVNGRKEKEKEGDSNSVSSDSCKLPARDGHSPLEKEGHASEQRVSENLESDSGTTSQSNTFLSLNPTLSLPPSPPPSLHFYGSSLLSSPLSRKSSFGFPLAVSPLSPPFLPLPFPFLSPLSAATTSHTPSTTPEHQQTSSSSSSIPTPCFSTSETNKMADSSSKPSRREPVANSTMTTSTSSRIHSCFGMREKTAANPFIRDIMNPFAATQQSSTEGPSVSRRPLSLSLYHGERNGEPNPNSQTPPNSHQTMLTSLQTPPTMFTGPAPLFSPQSLATTGLPLTPSYFQSTTFSSPSPLSSSSSTSAIRKNRSNSDSATYRNRNHECFPPPRSRSNSAGVKRAFPKKHLSDLSSMPCAPPLHRLPLSHASNLKTRRLSSELLPYLVSSSISTSLLQQSTFSLPPSVLPLSSPLLSTSLLPSRTPLLSSLPPSGTFVNSSETKAHKSSSSFTAVNPFPTRFGSKTIHYAVAGNSSTQPISTNLTSSHQIFYSQNISPESTPNFSWATLQNFSWASSNKPQLCVSSSSITREHLFLPMTPSFSSFCSTNQLLNDRAFQNNQKNWFGRGEVSSNDHVAGYKHERSDQLMQRGSLDFIRKSAMTPSFTRVPSISSKPPTKYPRPHSLPASTGCVIGGARKRCASIGSLSHIPRKPLRSRAHSSSSFSSKTGTLSPDSFTLPSSFSAQDKMIRWGMGSLIPMGLDSVIPQLPVELKRAGLPMPIDAPNNLGGPLNFPLNSSTPSFQGAPSTPSTQLKLTDSGVITPIATPTTTRLDGMPGSTSTLTYSAVTSDLPTTSGALTRLPTTPSAISGLSTASGSISGLLTTPSVVSCLYTSASSAISNISSGTLGAISGLAITPSAISGLLTTPSAVSGLATTPSAISGLLTSTSSTAFCLPTTSNQLTTSSTSKRKPQTTSKTASGKKSANQSRKPAAPSKKTNSTSSRPPAAKKRNNQLPKMSSLPHPFSMFPMSPPTPHTPIPHTNRLESGHTTPTNSLTPPTPFGRSPIPTPPVFTGMLPPMTNPQTGQPGIVPGQPSLSGSLHQTLAYWELERLYYHNLALLEQQRQYTLFLEAELRKMEQACQDQDHGNRVVAEQQPSYQQFWGCVSEMDFDITECSSLSPVGGEGCGFEGHDQNSNNDVTAFVEMSNGELRLHPEQDYYGNLLNQHDSSPSNSRHPHTNKQPPPQ